MFVKTDDRVQLYYQTAGDPANPALLLSNSLGTRWQMWQPQLAALTKHFYLISYDSRGHGESDKPAGPYSLTRLGQDALCVLGALGIKKAHFCGISMGGLTGLWLAVYAPERFLKIVVANTAAKIGTKEGWQSRAAAVREQGLAELAKSAPQRWFTPGFIRKHAALVEQLTDTLAEQDKEGYAACCDALAEADLRADLSRIQLPLLVIAGSADPVTTVADAEAIVQACPSASLVSLKASHISNLEQPAAFNRALSQFLRA
ncbi:3-oxoadipate enol-lactonase [Alishewanella sp. BS5-314]|jgi:3-oxoadipate enol-lactonase|uniref:3-oxoadipate enol-lactonase n=1 Tax=Alishewanella sp. BS5-314 TaxID=2755587 RepID=UPI0021BB509F|nr:3-oxoadipate enol-lactonase [Alishewanella sp. BS5-314]MCT8125703.1 3-oxoadipate enol-lactonase [Alishewanella sp. BS5-314]